MQPRFFFGLKGDVKNNVIYLDDNIVCYPCGHNVVIYYMTEKMQRFIPGIEGSQGITALAVSPSKKFLAVCEKGANAICTVYNIGKFLELSVEKKQQSIFDVPLKKRKILCSNEDQAKEFVSADFCAKNEKYLVTISAKSEARVTIWNWDKQRCIGSLEMIPDITKNQTIEQVSFSPNDQNVVVVTGVKFYRYIKLEGPVLKPLPIVITKREAEAHYSDNYTCHTWLADGRFIICNDHGQIFLLGADGEYKGFTVSDPRKEFFPIHSVTTFNGVTAENTGGPAAAQGKTGGAGKSGFIVAGDSGRLRVFVKSDVDPKKPYIRVDTTDDLIPTQVRDDNPISQMVYQDIDIHKITSLSLSPQEDTIVFTTSSGQLIKVMIDLGRPNEGQKYEHLISSFHSKQIHGLDVCVKKELVATCSSDRTVRLWSYTAGNMF